MLRTFVPLIAAALALCSAAPAVASGSDSQTSADNPKLSCTLSVEQQNGKALVTWTITGATSASIDPLSFPSGKVPLSGSQTTDFGGVIHVFLVITDADGHRVRCHAGAGGNVFFAPASTGSAPLPVVEDPDT